MPCPIFMVKKIKDYDVIAKAAAEVELEHGPIHSVLEKRAFNINIDPGSVLGAVAGAAVAQRHVKQESMRRKMEGDRQRVVGGSYYQQVQNLAANLSVVFTPFSVVLLVRDGTSQLTIDTIETEEMDANMRAAYARRDSQYFKNLLLNKIMSEVQLAEQIFARRFIKKKLELQNQVGKGGPEMGKQAQAAMGFTDVVKEVCALKSVFEKNAESPLGEFFMRAIQDNTVFVIEPDLDNIRPLHKYANIFRGPLRFLGLDAKKEELLEIEGDMLDPQFLSRNLEVGFLPDRVVFVVNDMVITQLPLFEMNPEGFEAFRRSDKQYFQNLFLAELGKRAEKKNLNETFANQELAEFAIEKNAAHFNVSEIFQKSNIHPKIYHLVLMREFGSHWMGFDPEVLVKEIEERFALSSGIADIPLNKILFTQLVNQSLQPFTNKVVFEKCVRAYNDKLINFTEDESGLDLGEIVFALSVTQELTPTDDIFNNFHISVLDYIAAELVGDGCRSVAPIVSIKGDHKQRFYALLNAQLLLAWDRAAVETTESEQLVADIASENQLIQTIALGVLSAGAESGNESLTFLTDAAKQVFRITPVPSHAIRAILADIESHAATKMYLDHKEQLLAQQRIAYNI